MEALVETYLTARKDRDLVEKELKLARYQCAEREKKMAELMSQHHLTRIHDLRFKFTLNLSKSDGQVRPYFWKRNYSEPNTTDSSLINGAEEAIHEFMKCRELKSTFESNRRKANSNLKQATKQLCASVTQCKTLKLGQHKIIIIPHDNRVTLTKLSP